MADTDTVVDTVDTMAVDTDTTEARGPLKPKLMPMLTTDTVDTMAVDTVDTVDSTAVDTDTTEGRGPLNLPLKPKLHPKLMLTTDTADTAVDTVDTTAADTVTAVDTDIMVELLLKQTNKPLNYNCQDQVTRNSFNLATMQKFPPLYFFET